jgi:hypothetical protein
MSEPLSIANGHGGAPLRERKPIHICAHRVQSMAETTINVIDALRGQQEQLKRLLKQKMWISDAPKATLSEIEAQINELKRLLVQLESDIQDQLRRGTR